MKRHLFLLALPLLALSACGTSGTPRSVVSSSSEPATSSSVQTTSTSEVKAEADLDEADYALFPSLYLEKLNSYTSYKAVTAGETKASIATQKINVTLIKSEYSYLHNESTGFVTSIHDCYYHGDKVAYKNKGDDEYTASSLTDYLSIYGTYPFDGSIEGYIIANDTITSISKEKKGNNFAYTLVFDVDKATTNVKKQMVEFGGLGAEPTFSSISLVVTVQGDFTPVSIVLNSKYRAKKGVTTNCSQKYTVTFSNFNESIEVPGLADVQSLL